LLLVTSYSLAFLNVGIVHSDDDHVADVQKKLKEIPWVGNVSLIDAHFSIPTVQQLEPFDALLVYSNYAFADGAALGDLLAGAIDSGKGVVVAVFSLTTFSSNTYLKGRFLGTFNNTYYVISAGARAVGPQLSLVSMVQSHPILTGVQKFDGGRGSFRGLGTWVYDAFRVAVWSDQQTPLIGARVVNGTVRVDLNFLPPSSDVNPDFWASSTDGARIIANSLNWVAGSCSQYVRCSACLSSLKAKTCGWCLDNNLCVFQNTTCKEELHDVKVCSS